MWVIPAVDVYQGRVVRLEQGDYDRMRVYATDPVGMAEFWVEHGADLVHVVDLAGARDGTADVDLWRRLASAGIPFQVGGGIRDVATARAAIEAGALRIVLGTVAVHDPPTLAAIADAVGPHRLVAAVDVREGRARGSGWLDEGRAVNAVLDQVLALGVRRALVTAVDRDGTMEGPDVELVEAVRASRPDLAVIASGGVRGVDDVRALAKAGAEAVIVGRALYEGAFTLEEATAALDDLG